jgi:hypothetical protein
MTPLPALLLGANIAGTPCSCGNLAGWLGEDLDDDAGSAGDRRDLCANEIPADARDRAGFAGRGGGRVDRRVLRIDVIHRRLQHHADRGRSRPIDGLPADRTAVLGEAGVARHGELLAGLPGTRGFAVEGEGDVARENRIRRNLRVVVRHGVSGRSD